MSNSPIDPCPRERTPVPHLAPLRPTVAVPPPAVSAPEGPPPDARKPRLGAVVWYSYHNIAYVCNKLMTVPAIVTRVNSPEDPRSTLALAVLCPVLGLKSPYAVPW